MSPTDARRRSRPVLSGFPLAADGATSTERDPIMLTQASSGRANRFGVRAFATFVVLISMVLLTVTGALLFLRPSFMRSISPYREVFADFHAVVSLVMLVAAAAHLWFNWPVVLSYIRRGATGGLRRWRELACALALGAVVTGAVFAGLCPISRLAPRHAGRAG